MKIGKASYSDANDIKSIFKQLQDPFYAAGIKPPVSKYSKVQWVRDEIDIGNIYVLRDDSDILASMCLIMNVDFLEDGEAYVDSMAVRKDMHGKGYGKRMIDFAIKKAMRYGKSVLTLESFVILDVKDFYEKLGFSLETELGDYDGHECYRFFMSL